MCLFFPQIFDGGIAVFTAMSVVAVVTLDRCLLSVMAAAFIVCMTVGLGQVLDHIAHIVEKCVFLPVIGLHLRQIAGFDLSGGLEE